jgi:hypothetical protein
MSPIILNAAVTLFAIVIGIIVAWRRNHSARKP